MKIRLGFVSNSSSSSFVAIGFSLPEKENKNIYLNFLMKVTNLSQQEIKDKISKMYRDEKYKEIQDNSEEMFKLARELFYEEFYAEYNNLEEYNEIKILDDTEVGAPRGQIFLGFDIMESKDEGDIQERIAPLSKYTSLLNQIKDKLGINDSEIKILTGTRMC